LKKEAQRVKGGKKKRRKGSTVWKLTPARSGGPDEKTQRPGSFKQVR